MLAQHSTCMARPLSKCHLVRLLRSIMRGDWCTVTFRLPAIAYLVSVCVCVLSWRVISISNAWKMVCKHHTGCTRINGVLLVRWCVITFFQANHQPQKRNYLYIIWEFFPRIFLRQWTCDILTTFGMSSRQMCVPPSINQSFKLNGQVTSFAHKSTVPRQAFSVTAMRIQWRNGRILT